MPRADQGTVSGHVRFIELNAQGAVLSDNVVHDAIVHFNLKGWHKTASTGSDGTFSITGLENGYWTVQAEYQGLVSPKHKVNVDADLKKVYDLNPNPPVKITRQVAAVSVSPPRMVLAVYSRPEKGDAAGPGATRVGPRAPRRNGCAQGQVGWQGQVVDVDQKGVAGARVSALGVKEGSNRLTVLGSASTGEDGRYSVCFRPADGVSKYFISVEREGYDDFISLLLGNEQPPESLTLEPDSTPREGPLLERNEATRRHSFSPRLMETLPVPGLRSFDSFALLAPGVAPPPETPNARGPGLSPGLGTAGQFAVNGLRSRENNFAIDGSDNNDEDIGTRRQGFVALAPQPVESLNEFQIVTALSDARFGRNLGGHVNALTKSGTPEFHGSLYGFVTDSRLNARDRFDRTAGDGPASFTLRRQSDGVPVLLDGNPIVTPNPAGGENPFTRTQLGFTAGGPARLIDSYFFGSFEHVRARARRESHFVVPTVEQRGLYDSGATGLILGSVVNPNLSLATLSPASVPGDAVFSLYPFPNNPLGPFGRNTYTSILPADASGTRLSAKLDRQFGAQNTDKVRRPWSLFRDGDHLTGRYNFSREASTVPVTGEALFSSVRPEVHTQNIAFYLNRQLSRRVSDVLRFSYGRTTLDFREERDPYLTPSTHFPGEEFLLNAPLLLNVTTPLLNGTLTQPAYVSAASAQGQALLNTLGYSNVTRAEQVAGPLGQVSLPGFSPLGVDVYHFPQSRANNTLQFADTVTFVKRVGLIYTFGADVRKTMINSTLDRNFRPLAVFGGLLSPQPAGGFPARLPGGEPLAPRAYPGASLAAGGLPTGMFQTLAVTPNSSVAIRYTQASFFAQRDWRARHNLSVNMGARLNYLTKLSTKGDTLETAFDLEELKSQAAPAIEDCVNIPQARAECENVVNAILSALPGDFATTFDADKYALDTRVGVAWSLNDRTVVRGGFGSYTSEFPGIVVGQSRNAFPNFLPLNFADLPAILNFDVNRPISPVFLSNPANPILRQNESTGIFVPGSLNTLAPGVTAISFLASRLRSLGKRNTFPFQGTILGLDLALPQKGLQTPYSLQYAVTLERRIWDRYALSVAYVGTRGIKLLRLSTPDLGLHNSRVDDFGVKITNLGNTHIPFLGGDVRAPQARAGASQMVIARTLFESSASSTYNSLQVELRKHYAERFQFRTALTYSHAIDDVSDFFDTAGAFALPQNSLRRSERASSNFDVRLRSVTHFVKDYRKDLVFFGPRRLGGWQFAGIVTAQTGQPFTVNSAIDINRDGNLTDRLNGTGGLLRGGATGDSGLQLRLAPG
ncbi:MAG: carboxypeptidase-like regulatory domain-containing protein, partial [Acidobacteria bacterium]|nr:carboxypeptidase-like regulatory domain-containing protein [Acidobacteriota bacterium]